MTHLTSLYAGPTVATQTGDVTIDGHCRTGYTRVDSRVSEHGTFHTNAYANWFQTGSGFGGDESSLGASAACGHAITDHLTATAAPGVDGVMREAPLDDAWDASALVGVRYNLLSHGGLNV